jgi:hypothetical protein
MRNIRARKGLTKPVIIFRTIYLLIKNLIQILLNYWLSALIAYRDEVWRSCGKV